MRSDFAHLSTKRPSNCDRAAATEKSPSAAADRLRQLVNKIGPAGDSRRSLNMLMVVKLNSVGGRQIEGFSSLRTTLCNLSRMPPNRSSP